MAEIKYSTTNKPTVLVGPIPAHSLKVARETKNVIANMTKLTPRSSQTDKVVPSSYNWKPTNPLMSKQAVSADVMPFCTAVKYAYAPFPGGITPESRMSDTKDNNM